MVTIKIHTGLLTPEHAVVAHLVTTNRDEGSLEEDAELRQCAGGEGVTLDVACTLGGRQLEETHEM